MTTLKSDLEAIVKIHGLEGVMFIVAQNPDKGKLAGQLLVSIETVLPMEDTAGAVLLLACKDKMEAFLPEIFGDVMKVQKNG